MLHWHRVGLLLLTLAFASLAQAKIFDFKSAKVAAYFGGAYGPGFENTLLSKSNSNSTTSVTLAQEEHSSLLGGEFGFIFSGGMVNLGFGAEILKPKDLPDISGKDSSDTELYTVTSEISVIIPKGKLEITLKRWPKSRLFLGGEGGWAYLIGRNSYTFTTAGSTAYSGLEDFYEDIRGNAPMFAGTLGFEKVLSDTTAFLVAAGYRSLNFTEVNHNRDITTFQGSVSKGDLARNIDGQVRSLDLSGYMLTGALRFWLK